MVTAAAQPRSLQEHILFREAGQWYSGRILEEYRFPALRVGSTDRRWEGEKIVYLHQKPIFVSPDWLQGTFTIYGLLRELRFVNQNEVSPLLAQRQALQENYQRHIY